MGVAERVNFIGFVSDEERNLLFKVADCAVFPSLYEPFGIVALEAMGLGRPVICLDRGGIRNQVSEEVGFRVGGDTPEEAIAGIHEAMRSIVERRELVALKGDLARERVKRHFSWEARGMELDRVYAYAISAALPREAAQEAGHQPSIISRNT